MPKYTDYIVIDKNELSEFIKTFTASNTKLEHFNSGVYALNNSILTKSFPLTPLIEEAFEAGKDYGYDLCDSNHCGANTDKSILNKEQYLNKKIEL